MPTRDRAPLGSPCWADLWTSDVEGSRAFYGELFGWEAQEPSPEFGGYFMFTRDGVPVAGAMGDMGDMKADDTWKIYLNTDDIAKTVEAARRRGPRSSPRPWRWPTSAPRPCSSTRPAPTSAPGSPGRFRGSPFWTSTARRAGSSCSPATSPLPSTSTARSSAGTTESVGDSDEFRYSAMSNPDGGGRAGRDHGRLRRSCPTACPPTGRSTGRSTTPDATRRPPSRTSAAPWSTAAEDTPYGRLATVTDPAGAQFKLHVASRA